MNAIELFEADGTPAGFWYCGKCRSTRGAAQTAEQCCRPLVCACGQECTSPWTACSVCRGRKAHERLEKRMNAARKVPEAEWDGPVVPDGSDGFSSMEEARDYYVNNGDVVPEPVWGTRPDALHLDAVSILEHATEEMYEGALESVSDEGLRSLQGMLNMWVQTYGPSPGWTEDSSILIVLAPSEEETDAD